MHFIKAYSLIIALSILVALGIVPSAYSYEPLPTDKVEQFIDIHRSIPVAENFREYLRPEYEDILLPEAIIVRVVCFSDGSGQMFSTSSGEEIWHQLTKQGALELNTVAVAIGEATCAKEWEVYYGPQSLHRESKRSWYL